MEHKFEELAKGWDDLAFFDAFLAFFVVFIGDWQNFYHAHSPDTPIPPFQLATEEVQYKMLADMIKAGHPLAKKIQSEGLNPTTSTTTTNTNAASTGTTATTTATTIATTTTTTTTATAPATPSAKSRVWTEEFEVAPIDNDERVFSQSMHSMSSPKLASKAAEEHQHSGASMSMSAISPSASSSSSSSPSLNLGNKTSSSIGGKYMDGLKSWGGKIYKAAANTVTSKNGANDNDDDFVDTPDNDNNGGKSGRQKDRSKKQETRYSYDEEALKFLGQFCHSQLFQTWFVRQQENASTKLNAIQDRFDYAIQNRPQFGGSSYSGCFKFLRGATLSRENIMTLTINLKSYIEDTAALTSNKELDEFVKSKEKRAHHLALGAYDPRVFNALNNLLDYRLKDTAGKNYPHGSMALFLLQILLEKSTDRYIIATANVFFPLIAELRNYKNPNEHAQSEFNSCHTYQ
ncbi:hypothetical protein RFI_19255 [Reticulomyxa filosa]|uniref:Uncharacterized protein n=1 Tax=Reticulomyxa filosa TaxID=46433 RepID=X6MY80_RETFI|nr:hypothetical protein RFI_19255 [Reticulomyxa filosa]|eukprot:ETO18040.1 hypothetical protein RFI_19255 [Reticulomyxa filosa]